MATVWVARKSMRRNTFLAPRRRKWSGQCLVRAKLSTRIATLQRLSSPEPARYRAGKFHPISANTPRRLGIAMKPDTRDYHVVKVVMTDGTEFTTRTTLGKPGDTLHLDVDPKSHRLGPAASSSFSIAAVGCRASEEVFGASSRSSALVSTARPAAHACGLFCVATNSAPIAGLLHLRSSASELFEEFFKPDIQNFDVSSMPPPMPTRSSPTSAK